MDMASSFLHKVQKTGRINVRECTPGLDLLRHYGNETSGGALSARHLIRPVSNYVENGPPMNQKRAYQNLFLLSRQKNQKIGIRGSKFINCLFPTFIKPVRMIKVFYGSALTKQTLTYSALTVSLLILLYFLF